MGKAQVEKRKGEEEDKREEDKGKERRIPVDNAARLHPPPRGLTHGREEAECGIAVTLRCDRVRAARRAVEDNRWSPPSPPQCVCVCVSARGRALVCVRVVVMVVVVVKTGF